MNSPSMADSSGDMQKMVLEAMNDIKSQGVFDQFRRECLADVDTKPTAQNLSQRVEAFVGRFLAQQQWNPSLKKNQLRDSLRKHISQSGMLTQGIDRIIEQIVNPKIFQVIKPKVDEAVCACLGLDVKLWQAENARHREEMQCLQQAIHHAQLDANIKDMQKKELEKQQQHMAEMQQQQQTYVSDNADFSFPPPPPPPGVYSQLPPLPQATSPFYPQPQFDNPFSFGGFGQHGFPNYMPGWMAPFYGLPPTSLGVWGTPQCSESTALQTPLPPTSQLIPPPPPGIPSGTTVDIPGTEALSSTSVSMASMHPPLPDATQAVPEMKPPVPPPPACSSASGVTPPLPLVPAPDPPPPPAVSDVGMPLSTGAPAASHSSHFFISPRMMAEAMIKTTEISTTRRERRKVRVDESLLIQRDEGGDYEPPLHIVRSLFAREGGGVTAAISSDGTDKCWLRGFDRDASGGVKLGDEAVDTVPVTVGGGEVAEGTVGDEIGRHKYKFAWKEDDDVALGDVTISSVHTSDLSSFTDSDSTSEADVAEEATDGKTKEAISRGVSVLATDGLPGASCHSKQAGLSLNDSLPLKAGERQVSDVCLSEAAIRKPRKLLALSYNYSDSDNEESREERRMRCAREKEERYLRRQARRAEMEVARKKKEEERQQHVTAGRNGDEDGMVVSLSEQRRQPEGEEEGELRLLTDNFRALASEEGTPVKDEGVHVSTYLLGEDSSQLGSAGRVNRRDCDERPCATAYTLSCALPSAVDERSSQDTVQFTGLSEELSSPLKKRRTKAEMKEELMQQKVEQRKAMRSRRQRTLNRRYLSDEFTSIFTENLQLAPHLGFSDPNAELVEQIVEVDATLELDSTSPVYLHDMEVQGECVIETETVSLLDGSAQLGIDLDAGDAAVTPVLSGVDTVTPFVAGDDSVTPVIAVDDTVTPFVACDDCVAPVLAGDGAVTTFVAGDDGVTSVLAGDDTVCETGVSEVVSQDLAHDTDGDVAVGYSGDLSDDAAQGREAYNDGDSVIEASADSFCVDENMFVLEQQHIGTGQVEEAICVGEQVSSRVSSPYSDIVSDESHGRSSASSLSAPSARFSSFHQRRVLGKLSSSDSDASVYKSSPKRSSQRKKPSSDDQRRHRRSGRLSGLRQASDKHHSRRTKHRHRTKKLSKRRSDHREFHVRHSLHDGHVSRLPQQRSSVRHGHHSRRRRHRDEQPVVAGTSENVRRPAHVGGRREPPPPLDSSAPTTSRQRPAVVSSVMADLELEPVSADDSTFDEIVGRSDSGGEVDENGSRPVSSTVSGVRSEMVADDVKGCQTLSEGEVSEEEGEVKEPDDWIPYHPQLVPARAARFADDVHNPQPCGPVMIRCGSWTGPRASISGLHYPAKQLFPRAVEHIRYR